MVNIKLDNKLSIVSDSNQYIMREFKGVGKDNKENHEAMGYFPTISGALKHYIDVCIKESECKSIPEMIKLYEDIEKKIDKLIKF